MKKDSDKQYEEMQMAIEQVVLDHLETKKALRIVTEKQKKVKRLVKNAVTIEEFRKLADTMSSLPT